MITRRPRLSTRLAGDLRVGGGGGGSSGAAAGTAERDADEDAGAPSSNFSFFVTSDTSETGDLGGLTGADERCQRLAETVGAGEKTWHAYLSVEHEALLFCGRLITSHGESNHDA